MGSAPRGRHKWGCGAAGTAHEEEIAKTGRSGESTSETLVWQRRTLPAHVHQQLAALLLPPALRAPHVHACSPVCSSQPRNQSPEPAQDQLSRAPQPGLHARSSTFKGLDARPSWEEDFFHPQGAERPEKKPPGPLLRMGLCLRLLLRLPSQAKAGPTSLLTTHCPAGYKGHLSPTWHSTLTAQHRIISHQTCAQRRDLGPPQPPIASADVPLGFF